MDQEYVEAVLSLVERIPSGRVTTYGLIADAVRERLARGGPRQVGSVMATNGDAVTWWRVVRADGTLPERHRAEALMAYAEEGTPLAGNAGVRVDLPRAVWLPPRTA